MNNLYLDKQFYHIYPLGFCGAPEYNDFVSAPENRLALIEQWIPHMKEIGVNALYLGPLFESTKHGYDTADYFRIDRRLGGGEYFKRLTDILHQNDIKVILDAVFNHVGRDFPAFRDLKANGSASKFRDWFKNVNFNASSPRGDNFSYESWNGHYELVKLDTAHPEIKEYFKSAVGKWIDDFGIDGIRLDACDCLDFGFLKDLSSFCKDKKPDFWIMGEIIHGDYNKWANNEMCDSVTNYECYKGLWSSFNDSNFFEIAYSLNREFGDSGLYKGKALYNFVDNHDVDRVASVIKEKVHLHPLYILLYSMPGIPSLYYGSEWGLTGKKVNGSDAPMRPFIDLEAMRRDPVDEHLTATVRKLAEIRTASKSLKYGNYRQLHINHKQFAFAREHDGERTAVFVNSDKDLVKVKAPQRIAGRDILNNEDIDVPVGGELALYPNWGRIIISGN